MTSLIGNAWGQVLGAGKTDGAMDAANLLKPMLARGELRCIGATTIGEYRQHMEKDAAFERRFQQVLQTYISSSLREKQQKPSLFCAMYSICDRVVGL